ncbi:MAG: glycosyl hydrolase [Clostridia bacterium]|nr:glycosyl hydrolase [Clostridia bacterium]
MRAIECLKNPPPETRAGTRWWWYGCAVTREEIERELSAMEKAGLGMVEIQIIYEAQADDPGAGLRHIDYFSPEFFEILDYTLDRAREHGIKVDFTLGSGWPFGGSFVTDVMAPAILVPYQHDVTGPASFSFDYTCVLNGEIERVIVCPVADGVMDWREARDVTDHVEPTYIYSWRWGSRLREVDIPAGEHRIYTFAVQKYKQNVGKPSPNMHGLAIDHCRRDVVDAYMRTLGQTLIDRLGRGRFNCFFCDSIELGGNNWSVNLLDEFKKRKGYDLSPYLPALWGNMGDITPLIRGDYFEVFGELALEGFFETFAEWCRRLGVKSRVQAHGIWADILKAYASADIPEGETFAEHDRCFVNTIHRRLAASAGIVYKKPVVSNESFTWLRMPRYLVTPEMIKRAADAIFTDGMNQIVNHGFSYSPENVAKPGWNFYASSMINMNNTWWDYYPPLCAYINRVSALMRAGDIMSDVAVYLPQADVRANSPMSELHMALKLEERIGRETVNKLQRAGYWFTFVNDEALENMPEDRFQVIVLAGVERVSLDVARALARLDGAGVMIVAVGGLPNDTCGFVNYSQNLKDVRELMAGLYNVLIAPDGGDGLIRTIAVVCQPDLVVKGDAARDVGFICRDIDGSRVYFLANIAAKARLCRLSIPGEDPVRIYDPMSMTDVAPVIVEISDGRTHLALDMDENQSLVLVADEEGLPPAIPKLDIQSTLTGWRLSVNGCEIARDMVNPLGWDQFEKTRYFSGEGIYEAEFDWPGGEARILFTSVNCCCTVELNGVEQGRLFMAPYRLSLKDIKPGINTLTVKVVNTWINHVIDPAKEPEFSREPVCNQWPYFNAIIDDIRHRRFEPVRERDMIKTPQPSGLNGAVYLLSTKEWLRRS